MLERRKFLTGLTGLICAPAIVRAASIMPVRSERVDRKRWFLQMDPLPWDGQGGSDFVIKSYDDSGNQGLDAILNDPFCYRIFTG